MINVQTGFISFAAANAEVPESEAAPVGWHIRPPRGGMARAAPGGAHLNTAGAANN